MSYICILPCVVFLFAACSFHIFCKCLLQPRFPIRSSDVRISPNISRSQAPLNSLPLTTSDRRLSHPRHFIPILLHLVIVASLRISGAPPPRPVRPNPIITLVQAKAKAEEKRAAVELKEAQKRTFEGIPGHKRLESFSVASTAPPVVSPRQNRSTMLRVLKDTPPPSSYQCTFFFSSACAIRTESHDI